MGKITRYAMRNIHVETFAETDIATPPDQSAAPARMKNFTHQVETLVIIPMLLIPVQTLMF